jgi:hypothetical protein
MRFASIALLGLAALQAHTAAAGTGAAREGFGLGIIVGEPTGVCGKLWLSPSTAMDGAAAWSIADEGALHLHADFLVHRFDLLHIERGQLPFYYGVGGRIKFQEGDTRLGVRVPVGLAYLFESTPIDLFLEIVPLLDLAPETDFTLNGSIGVRYFFR